MVVNILGVWVLSISTLNIYGWNTYHIKYLCESDPNLDNHLVTGIVDWPNLPVIVLHQVGQQPRLLLSVLQPRFVWVIPCIWNKSKLKFSNWSIKKLIDSKIISEMKYWLIQNSKPQIKQYLKIKCP